MIDYLEQLERDLVEAIDRGEVEREARWRRRLPRRRRRPDWTLVTGAVVAMLAIAVVVAVVRFGSADERAVAPPPTESNHRAAPTRPHIPLRLVGDVTRIDPTTWRGQAHGPVGVGTLTLTGTVNLTARPCCDTPGSKAPHSSHTIRFTWTSARGTISGQVRNTTYRRPHGRFVWDGLGRITGATGALAGYRGREVGIAGDTRIATPDRARIIL